jgi:hypothetical protein
MPGRFFTLFWNVVSYFCPFVSIFLRLFILSLRVLCFYFVLFYKHRSQLSRGLGPGPWPSSFGHWVRVPFKAQTFILVLCGHKPRSWLITHLRSCARCLSGFRISEVILDWNTAQGRIHKRWWWWWCRCHNISVIIRRFLRFFASNKCNCSSSFNTSLFLCRNFDSLFPYPFLEFSCAFYSSCVLECDRCVVRS